MKPHDTFHDAFKRLKQQHGGAILLFVAEGIVNAYWGDATFLAGTFGLNCDRAGDGPTNGIKRASFPESVLERNLEALIQRGVNVFIDRTTCIVSRQHNWRNNLRQQHEPTYEPTPDEIESAAATIRSSWTEAESQSRAGVFRTIPYEMTAVKHEEFFGHAANGNRKCRQIGKQPEV